MAILVTGGAGYIGSHACVELLNEGHDVIVIDNYSNSKAESLNRIRDITGKTIPAYEVDLLNKQDVEKVFKENVITAVIHFAGLKAVGESVHVPLWYYKNNVLGTIILCEVMKQYGVKKLVFSSSATVYGLPEKVPITEDAPLTAINPYGRTKLLIEKLLTDLYESDPTWKIALLRYFNPIGAHPSGKIGEDPNGIPNNLLPYISQVAIGKLDYLRIFGGDYPTKDGTGIRDYIHVVDLVLGHIRALEYLDGATGIEAFNLGTGKGYSVLDMVKAFQSVSHQEIPYSIVNRRSGDAAICYADTTKAQKYLQWQATRGLETMCKDAWRWQQKNPNGYGDLLATSHN